MGIWKGIKESVADRLTDYSHTSEPIEVAGDHNSDGSKMTGRSRTFIIKEISPKELENCYRFSGLIKKAVNRKARDALKRGFLVQPDSEDRELRIRMNDAVRDYMRKTKLAPKAIKALREMFVFGDGFLEVVYDDALPGHEPVPDGAKPLRVVTLDPLSIRPVMPNPDDPEGGDEPIAYFSGPKVRDLQRREIEEWRDDGAPAPEGVTVIHPSRLVHFQSESFRQHPDGLGMSIIEAAYLNVISKTVADKSAADVLEWYAQGFFTLTIKRATPKQIKKALRVLKDAKKHRRNYFAASDRAEFDIKSPTLGNWRPFYEQFYIEIAAAMEMPVMLLTGVQKGTVTGSSVDAVEYYDDVGSFQTLTLDAPFHTLVSRVLGRSDFSLRWVPIFVDKQTEADIRFKDGQTAAALAGAKILTRRQAIRFIKNGGELPDDEEVPDDYIEDAPSRESPDPGAGDPDAGDEAPPMPESRRERPPTAFLWDDEDEEDPEGLDEEIEPEDAPDGVWVPPLLTNANLTRTLRTLAGDTHDLGA